MSTQVPRPMFVDDFSPFTPCCDFVIVDAGRLLPVSNHSCECSVGENPILRETEDASGTEASDVPMLDSGSSGDKSVIWSDFVVSLDNDGSIEYERMSSEPGTAEGSVGVSKSKILVELEHGKAWQPSSEP